MEEKNKIDIKHLITTKDVYAIRNYVDTTPFSDIVDDIDELSELEVILFFRFLKTEAASELFSYLDEETQQMIIQSLTKKEITEILNELYTDEIADILEALPVDMAKTILLSVDKTTRIKVNQLLQFKENEVGSIMSVDIILLNENLTNKEALQLIKNKREESEIGQFYYVVDKKNKLLGATTLEDIVFAPKDHTISQKIQNVMSIYTKQSKEEAALIFANEDYSYLPVVNENGVVMGMLTSDDVIDIITKEATEDLYKVSGISTNQTSTSYLKTSVFLLIKSRIFWLIILMVGSTLSQIMIQFLTEGFEKQLQLAGISSAILIALIPVTSATSGNAGSQSTSTLTRAVSLGELKEDKFNKVLWKETQVGLLLGVILAIVNFIRLMLYYLITGDILGSKWLFIIMVSLVSSISLFISITLSKMLGTSILILGIKSKKDPAVMATPLLTTLIDSLSTLVFFGLSYAILLPILSFIPSI